MSYLIPIKTESTQFWDARLEKGTIKTQYCIKQLLFFDTSSSSVMLLAIIYVTLFTMSAKEEPCELICPVSRCMYVINHITLFTWHGSTCQKGFVEFWNRSRKALNTAIYESATFNSNHNLKLLDDPSLNLKWEGSKNFKTVAHMSQYTVTLALITTTSIYLYYTYFFSWMCFTQKTENGKQYIRKKIISGNLDICLNLWITSLFKPVSLHVSYWHSLWNI